MKEGRDAGPEEVLYLSVPGMSSPLVKSSEWGHALQDPPRLDSADVGRGASLTFRLSARERPEGFRFLRSLGLFYLGLRTAVHSMVRSPITMVPDILSPSILPL